MAVPHEIKVETPQLEVRSLSDTGFVIPPGWYGMVEAAGVGIVRRAGMELVSGMSALERLGNPEVDSRTPDFGGRRLVRVDGGYIALNFAKYREKDHTSAERSRRYREKKMKQGTPTPLLDSLKVGLNAGIPLNQPPANRG
jgi:hypothetical protein